MSGAESGGACAPLTFRAAREIVRGLGLTIRRTGYGSEMRVADPSLPRRSARPKRTTRTTWKTRSALRRSWRGR